MMEECITSLLSKSATSTRRLTALADYLKTYIAEVGLPGCEGGSSGELRVPGLVRAKDWDVAYKFAGKFRLLISLKSLLKNISGTVPFPTGLMTCKVSLRTYNSCDLKL
jgi:hypothetical protein